MAVKLIALDLDGTTLNSDSELTNRTKKALNEAMVRGIHVVVATGRVYSALPDEIKSFRGIEYIITSNGAVITEINNQEIIYDNCIDEKEIDAIYKLLGSHDFMVEIFIRGRAYVEKSIMDKLEEVGLSKSSVKYIRKTRTPYENVLKLMMENRSHIENINVVFGNQKDREYMREKLLLLPNVTITSSMEHNLEIGGETTSKASALLHLCKKLNVRPEEIMACGDSPNDEAMIRLAGTSVAMGNAKDSLKKIAKHITATNDEDGVALAIQKLAL
ncbi:MAG: HAD family hydrolase [Aminipila sp.]